MNLHGVKGPPWMANCSPFDFAGAAAALLFTAIFFVGVLQPISVRNKQRELHEAAAARERRHLLSVQNSVRHLQTELDRARQEIAANPRQALPLSSLNTRLSELASISKQAGLTVNEMKPADSFPQGRFAAVPIHMTGRANYRACAAFMHLVHDQFYDVAVTSFKMTAMPEHDESICGFELELRWLATAEQSSLRTASSQ